MDPETIKVLADMPVMIVLIFLVVKQQLQIEKLMAQMIESEKHHQEQMLALANARCPLTHTQLITAVDK